MSVYGSFTEPQEKGRVTRLTFGILFLLSLFGMLSPVLAQSSTVWEEALPIEAPLDIEWIGEMEHDGVPIRSLRYTGSVWKSEPQRVYALYAQPEGEGPFPTILQIHGGGQTCYPSNVALFVKHGYACLSFDWCGPRDNRSESEITMWHEDFRGEYMDPEDHEPGQNIVHHAILAAIRGIDVLSEQPGVDQERIGVQGISWGGYITWLVNALDPRLKAATPVYGIGGLEKQWSGIGEGVENRSEKFQEYWKTNYDPASYADKQRSPVLFVNASNDFFGQLDECEARMAQLTVSHRRTYGANRMHSLDPENVSAAMAWFDTHLKGDGAFPEAPKLVLSVKGDGVLVGIVKVDDSRPVKTVAVDLARGPFHPLLKCWIRYEASKNESGEWEVELPLVDSAQPISTIPQVIYEDGALLSGPFREVVPGKVVAGPRATALTSDTISDWDNGPPGWIIQTGTDFVPSPENSPHLGLKEIDGHPALVYDTENPPGNIRLITRLTADAARNKGNQRSLAIWTHDLGKITLKTNQFLRQPGAETHRCDFEAGEGWIKSVLPLDDFALIDEGSGNPPEGVDEHLQNWNDVHLFEIASETTPKGTPAIGWIGWE